MQVLCKEGGMPLIMCVEKDGANCLYFAAQEGHAAVVEVGAGGGRQREAGGRVPETGRETKRKSEREIERERERERESV